MERPCCLLVFGDTGILRSLADYLRKNNWLEVIKRRAGDEPAALAEIHVDVVVVDAAQTTPELFEVLLTTCTQPFPAILSIDPLTYQLTLLAYPKAQPSLENVAQVIGILSLALSQLVEQPVRK